jgi:diacylglycerol kinase (ATP)
LFGVFKARYFCCVAGAGLDSEITRRANLLPRWLRANGGYAISLPSTLSSFSPTIVRISFPNDEHPSELSEHSAKSTFIVAIANAPTYGGGMRIAPRAKLDDGKLDVCIIRELSKLRFLRLFPTVYSGKHLDVPEVEYFQNERLRIETERTLQVYADGEYVCQTPVEIRVVPQALSVIEC